MTRRLILGVAAIALVATACSDLGAGEATCVPPGRDLGSSISDANILSAQAVPTAKYTPCLERLHLGWDSVIWSAEDGIAVIRILAVGTWGEFPFLAASVTESCDVSAAILVESGYPDIQRYEAVESRSAEIPITIIPSGELPLRRAQLLADELAGVEIDDHPVRLTIDVDVEDRVGPRVALALMRGHYVWIIDELDADEGTVELRSNDPDAEGSGLDPGEALDLIEKVVPDPFYRGDWYFTFDGGCITYEFDAKGALAETVAEDAEDALGFFPAWRLSEIGRDAG